MAEQAGRELRISLTVDVDPDANRPVPGRPDAVSARADGARHEACFRGLDVLLTALENRCLPATFFWEGRTLQVLEATDPALLERAAGHALAEHSCHGMRHEDFAGTMSGRPLDDGEALAALREAGDAVAAAFGAPPPGFRAPYCRLTPAVCRALSDLGYSYDASLTHDVAAGESLEPGELADAPGVVELPMPCAKDSLGRPISAYLWQLFERKRTFFEYVRLVRGLRERCAGALVQVALHPWHIFVGSDGLALADGTPLLLGFLDALQEVDGTSFTTNIDYLRDVWPVRQAGSS